MAPLIYFSYGMTKSGSTLAFELARTALIESGNPQPRLSLAAVENRNRLNFCRHIDAERAEAIRAEVAEIGTPIAIKTHTRPDPDVVKMLQNGEASAHACFRDPREIALSMVDHGNRSRAKGAREFSEYGTVRDTIDEIMHQTNSLLAWLSLPNVRPLFYNHVAFDMKSATKTILSELGLAGDVANIIKTATTERFTQKNKAIRARYEAEMDADDSKLFKRIFAPFFNRLIDRYAELPRGREPLLDPAKPLCDWSHAKP